MIEIERKFLVTSNDFIQQAFSNKRIVQAYLSSVPDRAVRIRIKGAQGFLTIKGKSSKSGMSRLEWEREIPVQEAEELLTICEMGMIDKVRYEVKNGNHTFEVDVFAGENEGLIIAEIELQNEDETFERPSWLGEEVTNDNKYYNVYLTQKPFKSWTL
ncbi:CYTH domain-containing protein [Flavobacterium sp.]